MKIRKFTWFLLKVCISQKQISPKPENTAAPLRYHNNTDKKKSHLDLSKQLFTSLTLEDLRVKLDVPWVLFVKVLALNPNKCNLINNSFWFEEILTPAAILCPCVCVAVCQPAPSSRTPWNCACVVPLFFLLSFFLLDSSQLSKKICLWVQGKHGAKTNLWNGQAAVLFSPPKEFWAEAGVVRGREALCMGWCLEG